MADQYNTNELFGLFQQWLADVERTKQDQKQWARDGSAPNVSHDEMEQYRRGMHYNSGGQNQGPQLDAPMYQQPTFADLFSGPQSLQDRIAREDYGPRGDPRSDPSFHRWQQGEMHNTTRGSGYDYLEGRAGNDTLGASQSLSGSGDFLRGDRPPQTQEEINELWRYQPTDGVGEMIERIVRESGGRLMAPWEANNLMGNDPGGQNQPPQNRMLEMFLAPENQPLPNNPMFRHQR